jgi:hypothetical protein
VHAEAAYLFRHALLRQAAYQLQLPGDRQRLHALAFDVIENACGGPAPPAPSLDSFAPAPLPPHPTDPFAAELAAHASAAGSSSAPLYFRRAASVAVREHRSEAAQDAWPPWRSR